MQTPKKQRGVALILALMITALIGVLAVEMSWRFELDVSRSGNRWYGMQAKAYLEGAEELAMSVLTDDAQNDDTSQADHLGEIWAQEAQPFPTDHGWVSGKIEDAHGRFNINSMLPDPNRCPNGAPLPNNGQPCRIGVDCFKFTPAQRVFIRMLQTFNLGNEDEPAFIEKDQAEAIAEAMIDWLDTDSELTGFGGAESDYYEQLPLPISIANGPMISVSEVQVIRGMTPELYRAMLPFIVALPAGEDNRMNINTVSIPIIRSLTERAGGNANDNNTNNNPDAGNCDLFPMTLDIATEIASVVRAGEFTSLNDLQEDPGLPSIWLDNNNNLSFDVELVGVGPSTYFLFFGETAIGEEHIRRSQSLIKRTQAGGGNNNNQENNQGNNSNNQGNDENNGNQSNNGNTPNSNNNANTNNNSNTNNAPNTQAGQDVEIEVVRRTDANF